MNLEMRDFAIRSIGCIVCRMRGKPPLPAAKHHLTSTGRHGSGKRRGERFTVGLCDYHHQGASQVGTVRADDLRADGYGPSYADNAREFRELYPDTLLLEVQERFLKLWEQGKIADAS